MLRHLLLLSIIALLPGAQLAATDAASKPNFLFIAIDDLNDHLGYFAEESGNFLQVIYPEPAKRAEVARRLSPNLDRLAASSTPFVRAYCASPICNASRTALLTGVRPHRTGVLENTQYFRELEGSRNLITLPQYLQGHGYFTAGIGKIFHHAAGKFADAPSWSRWVPRRVGTSDKLLDDYYPSPGLRRFATESWPFGPNPEGITESDDYINADFVARLLAEGRAQIRAEDDQQVELVLPDEQPFFLACGIFRPHRPWKSPREFYKLFPAEEMTGITAETLQTIIDDVGDLPPGGLARTEYKRGAGDFAFLVRAGREREIAGGVETVWRYKIQAYLAAVAFADHCVGRVIEGLERSPRRNNTIVVLWSDHGMHLGAKYHNGKATLWEVSNRSVLMIRDPRLAQPAGEFCRRPVSLIDLYPTIVSLAGLSVPDGLDGRDLSPLLRDPSREWPHAALGTWHGHHTLRTGAWRFIRYGNGDEELYDWRRDPFELINRAAKPTPEASATLTALGTMLDTLLRNPRPLFRADVNQQRLP